MLGGKSIITRIIPGVFLTGIVACAEAPSDSLTADASVLAITQGIDGVYFYPPLGPQPTATGTFEATLLDGLTVTIESEDAAGAIAVLATFDATTQPSVALLAEHERYWVNIPAATYLTDAAKTYRIRVLLDGSELGDAVLTPRVFDVMAYNPALPIGVAVRIEGSGAVRAAARARLVGNGRQRHCTDGIRNKDETGVDCGGSCPACETCTDGIRNQGETGVDCGGPCAACPATWHWRLVGISDCSGTDVAYVGGSSTPSGHCPGATTAICWDGAAYVNNGAPLSGAWCAYKSSAHCAGGARPGYYYQCVYE